jgi:endonuclease/exonuclease/phosphatase (EEP) superfamily protein YafD
VFPRKPLENHHVSGRWRACITATAWCYVAGVFLTWLLIVWGGDRWWLATVVLFGPRWLYVLPLVVLLPLVLVAERRLMPVLILAAVVCLGPIAQWQVPRRCPGISTGRPSLRVLTCNVEAWRHGSDLALRRLIDRVAPDLVMLQEHCDEVPLVWPDGWTVRTVGRLLIASRFDLAPIDSLDCQSRSMPQNYPDALACVVHTPHGELVVCNVHLETPREGLESVLSRRTVLRLGGAKDLQEVIRDRDDQSRQVRRFVNKTLPANVVAGDFNMPSDSAIYRRHWNDYTNAFQRVGWGYGYTKWSRVRFLTYGLRIDHILTDDTCRPVRCWVEEDIHSDHRPVVADVELQL